MAPGDLPENTRHRLFGQGWRFVVVGLAATATHVACGLILAEAAGLAPIWANLLAFCIALFVSYLGNHSWTFAARGAHAFHFPRFTAIALAGLSLNQGIVYVMVGVMALDYRVALAVVVLVVPALSFMLNRGWVFARTQ